MKKVKISELPLSQTSKGLFTIATNEKNESVRVALTPLDEATEDIKEIKAEDANNVKKAEKGAKGGIATLDEGGKVPTPQLPSATQTASGIISGTDKKKLDELHNYDDAEVKANAQAIGVNTKAIEANTQSIANLETKKADKTTTDALQTNVNKINQILPGKADDVEVNEYNISAINGGITYNGLQDAIDALISHFNGKSIPKGTKCTFVRTSSNLPETYYLYNNNPCLSYNWDFEPIGGYSQELFKTLPMVEFNKDTNRWSVYKEWGGRDDITTAEMSYIYNFAFLDNSKLKVVEQAQNPKFIIPKTSSRYGAYFNNFDVTLNYSYTEYLVLGIGGGSAGQSIYNPRLKGKLSVSHNESLVGILTPFIPTSLYIYNCPLLRILRLVCSDNLESYGLSTLPKLSYDSISYIPTKAINTSTVTVSVHQNIYALLKGTATAEEYLATGHTKEEWMKIDTDAVAKQISFAQG